MTKIICTIGPASQDKEIMHQMAQNGMAVARLNFSHGSHSQHTENINQIKQINKEHGTHIKLLQDLEGFRIRVGKLPGDRPIKLKENQKIDLKPVSSHFQSEEKVIIPFDYKGDLNQIKEDDDIFMDDGNILLKVLTLSQDHIKAQVVIPGIVRNYMGINIPELNIDYDFLTEKDKEDILLGIHILC